MSITRPGRHRAPRTSLRTRLAELLGRHHDDSGHAVWLAQVARLPTFEPTGPGPEGFDRVPADPSIPA